MLLYISSEGVKPAAVCLFADTAGVSQNEKRGLNVNVSRAIRDSAGEDSLLYYSTIGEHLKHVDVPMCRDRARAHDAQSMGRLGNDEAQFRTCSNTLVDNDTTQLHPQGLTPRAHPLMLVKSLRT